jgi:hypothetical protein
MKRCSPAIGEAVLAISRRPPTAKLHRENILDELRGIGALVGVARLAGESGLKHPEPAKYLVALTKHLEEIGDRIDHLAAEMAKDAATTQPATETNP